MRMMARTLSMCLIFASDCMVPAGGLAQRPISVRTAPAPIRATAERLVWSPRGDAGLGGVSSDGRLVPFLSSNDPTGRQIPRALFLHDLRTGTDRRLTAPPPSDTEGAPSDNHCVCALSRTASHMAYVWWTGVGTAPRAELRVIRLAEPGIPMPRTIFGGRAGATPQRAGLWIIPFDWTPDGRWVVASIEDNTNGQTQIALISAVADSVNVLATVASNRLAAAPALSPDGRHLAFDVREEGAMGRGIFLIDVRTGGLVRLPLESGGLYVVGWSPDGRQLLFTSDRRGSRDLYAVAIDRDRAGEPVMVRRGMRALSGLGVTKQGALFYRVRHFESPTLHVTALDVGDTVAAFRAVDRVSRPMFWRTYHAWSRDAKQLAYWADRYEEGSPPILVIRSLDSRRDRELRPRLSRGYDLRWSPDDRLLYARGDDEEGRAGVFLIDARSGEASRLAGVDDIRHWSPSGGRIYFDRAITTTADTTAIIERVLSTGAEREVYRGPAGGPRRLALSPEAGTVYYRRAAGSGQGFDVVARDLETSSDRTLVAGRAIGALELSPDGRYLTTPSDGGILLIPVGGSPPRQLAGINWVYWTRTSSGMLLRQADLAGNQFQPVAYWWMHPDSTSRRRLVLPIGTNVVGDAALSPDGRHFAYTEREQLATTPSELWVLEDILPSSRPGAVGNPPGQVTASVTTARQTIVHPGLAGYNVALMSAGIGYRDPQLAPAVSRLRPGWLRFPAGARAGAYDWQNGLSRQSWVDQFRGTMFLGDLQGAFRMLEAKGGERIEDASALAAVAGARGLIVCVNVFTDTPESAGRYAAYAKAHGIKVLAWQLANEPTFFPAFFPDARVYAEKMRPFADAIRAVDPGAHISLSLSLAGLEDRTWDSTLAAVTPRYWDVLTYHHYPQLRGNRDDLMAGLNQVLASASLDRVRSYVRALFGAMPVIITEAAPGSGSARPESSLVGTLYGGIWSAEYVMRLSQSPQVWHVGMHQVLGPGGIDLTDDHRQDLLSAAGGSTSIGYDYGLFVSAQGAAYAVAAEAINAASVAFPTIVTGGGTVPLWSAGASIPAIHAQAYRTGATTTLLVSNKGDRTEELVIEMDGRQVGASLQVVMVTGPAPDSRNGPGSAIVVPRESTATGAVVIPPYSITRISWR